MKKKDSWTTGVFTRNRVRDLNWFIDFICSVTRNRWMRDEWNEWLHCYKDLPQGSKEIILRHMLKLKRYCQSANFRLVLIFYCLESFFFAEFFVNYRLLILMILGFFCRMVFGFLSATLPLASELAWVSELSSLIGETKEEPMDFESCQSFLVCWNLQLVCILVFELKGEYQFKHTEKFLPVC